MPLKEQFFLREWNKFLKETDILDEMSPEYIDQTRDFLAKVNPEKLSFNKIFGNKFRIVIPFSQQNSTELPNDSDLKTKYPDFMIFKSNLEMYGYKFDLKKGIISKEEEAVIPKGPKQGQTIKREKKERIGKYIQHLIDLKHKYNNEKNIEEVSIIYKKIKEIYPPFQAGKYVAFDLILKEYEKLSFDELGKKDLSIIISRHPIDVLRMSDFDHIQSCHSEGGSYFNCAINESKGHGLVAYVVNTKDLEKINLNDEEIFRDRQRDVQGIIPLSRLKLRRIIDIKNKVEYPIPENITYGDKILGFKTEVMNWAKKQIGDLDALPEEENLRYTGGAYGDTSPAYLLNNLLKDRQADYSDIEYQKSEIEDQLKKFISNLNQKMNLYIEQNNLKEDIPSAAIDMVMVIDTGREEQSLSYIYDIIFDIDIDIDIHYSYYNNLRQKFRENKFNLKETLSNAFAQLFQFEESRIQISSDLYLSSKFFLKITSHYRNIETINDFIDKFSHHEQNFEKIKKYKEIVFDFLEPIIRSVNNDPIK